MAATEPAQRFTPQEIVGNLDSQFEKARESGDLSFFPSTVYKHTDVGVEFEITLCPALQQKPVELSNGVAQRESHPSIPDAVPSYDGLPKKDPFSPPYVKGLFLGHLTQEEDTEEEFVALLNKYSVVPDHFLLVTKEFSPQATPLTPDQLSKSYQLLQAANRAGKRLLSFFNCGVLSGASQPHKHVQFLPLKDDAPIERLAKRARLEQPDKPFALNVPWATFVLRLPSSTRDAPPSEVSQILGSSFMTLLDLVINNIRRQPDYPPGKPSFNVLLTLEHLHLIPRRQEAHRLRATGEELPVNSLGFCGMLLVKSEVELEAVKNEGVGRILSAVACEEIEEIQCSRIESNL